MTSAFLATGTMAQEGVNVGGVVEKEGWKEEEGC